MTGAGERSRSKGNGRSTRLIATIACLSAFVILIGLGVWQLQRKVWKDALIARIDARSHTAATLIPPEDDWLDWNTENGEYFTVKLRGAFLHEGESPVLGAITAAYGDTIQGAYLLTPLRLTNGAIVFIERGFVPRLLLEHPPRLNNLPDDEVEIIGVLRGPQKRGLFTPTDDTSRNLWFTRDPLAMATAHGLTRTAPFYVQATAISPPQPALWPKPMPVRIDLPNNHLHYALTWFGLSGALIAVLIAFHLRRRLERSVETT